VLNEQISKGIGGRVARTSTRPDGTVDLEGTFIEHRDSGGGLSYEQAAVLLCVRLSGKPGPQAEVELADAPCPTNVTSKPPNFGSIDKIVTSASSVILRESGVAQLTDEEQPRAD
jgi:hypothetical protein